MKRPRIRLDQPDTSAGLATEKADAGVMDLTLDQSADKAPEWTDPTDAGSVEPTKSAHRSKEAQKARRRKDRLRKRENRRLTKGVAALGITPETARAPSLPAALECSRRSSATTKEDLPDRPAKKSLVFRERTAFDNHMRDGTFLILTCNPSEGGPDRLKTLQLLENAGWIGLTELKTVAKAWAARMKTVEEAKAMERSKIPTGSGGQYLLATRRSERLVTSYWVKETSLVSDLGARNAFKMSLSKDNFSLYQHISRGVRLDDWLEAFKESTHTIARALKFAKASKLVKGTWSFDIAVANVYLFCSWGMSFGSVLVLVLTLPYRQST